MYSKTNNNINNNPDDILYSNNKENIIKYQELVPSKQYQTRIQQKENNLQYFPIVTKDTFEGKHTIYLAAQSNNNLNDYLQNNEYIYSNEKNNNQISNNKKAILLPEKSIQLQIENGKLNSLLDSSFKNENSNNIINYNNNDNNINTYDNTNSNKEEKIQEKNNTKIYNYNHIKNDFISTTKNLYKSKRNNKNKELFHS